MLDERKVAILRAVVQEYITTGLPVGSTHVAGAPGVRVSSATVRNEMSVLEQEGFLAQPHTSAGRIPTDKGYRFFVDHLTHPDLDTASTQQVGMFFDAANVRLEELLHRTSNLLARLTNYAAVVVGSQTEAAVVRSVQVVALSSTIGLIVVVLSNGSVEDARFELSDRASDATAAAATAHLSTQLIGRPVTAAPEPAGLVGSGDADVDELCRVAWSAIRRDDEETPVYVGGTAAMAEAFDAVEVVRQVLHTLEQQYVVVGLVRDLIDRGLSVAIGTEHGVEPLAACSVIVAPVVVEGDQVGSIGVLGPTRMNYPQALATVEVVSDRLGRRLGEG